MAVAQVPAPASTQATRRRSRVLAFCRQQPMGAVSFVIILVMMYAGIFAEWVAPYDPLDLDWAQILAAPSWQHW